MRTRKQPIGLFLAAVTFGLLAWLCVGPVVAAQKLTPAQAKDHIGEEATVCGVVASTRYATSSRGQPTFLNLDKPYPNQVFTVVIWGRNRAKFGKPEVDYKGERICVTGMIDEYRGMPQIEASDPSQIKVEREGKSERRNTQ